MSTTTNEETNRIWKELVSVIQDHGGFVHPNLELKIIVAGFGDPNSAAICESDADGGTCFLNRGVFTGTKTINEGETLIRLPVALSINGKDYPSIYNPAVSGSSESSSQRHASPWLRCLASYYDAAALGRKGTEDGIASCKNNGGNDECSEALQRISTAYIGSLPGEYDTLWQWSDDEIKEFLAGTSPQAGNLSTGSIDSWKVDKNSIRERYQTQIKPYLKECCKFAKDKLPADDENLEEELKQFEFACQALSTRCFHLDTFEESSADDENYPGPFLLPIIDLLNHTSDPSAKCTSLQREAQSANKGDGTSGLVYNNSDSFLMTAQRKIQPGEEIFHSYGDELTASQFLQTFGFVPETAMKQAVANVDTTPRDLTPALLSKQAIFEACWEVIESDVPVSLAKSMEEDDMIEDETWNVSVDRSRIQKVEYIPDDILITPMRKTAEVGMADNHDSNSMLTDELVTLCCVPFLPKCALAEITKRTLLDKSILEDYYLGKLVCVSLLKAIKSKLNKYTPIPPNTLSNLMLKNDGKDRTDKDVLQDLLEMPLDKRNHMIGAKHQRLAYALTIRIEEKKNLEALQNEILDCLTSLDQNGENDDSDFKRQKMDS